MAAVRRPDAFCIEEERMSTQPQAYSGTILIAPTKAPSLARPRETHSVREQVERFARPAAMWMFAAFCLLAALRLAIFQSGQIQLLEEAGNGDLYSLIT